jgi:hypothetical protein
LIALVVVEAIHVGMQEGEIKKRLREGLGEKLHESLHEQIASSQDVIYHTVGQKFVSLARQLTATIGSQIEELRTEQLRIIDQKKDEHFSVAQEKQRLDTIGGRLQQVFDVLSHAAYGRALPPEELDRLARGRATLIGE